MADDYIEPSIQKLRMMWMNRAFANDEEARQAAINFDQLMAELAGHAEMHRQGILVLQGGEDEAPDRPSASQMWLELIAEIDRSVPLIPPMVKRYRDLLSEEGLHLAFSQSEEFAGSVGTMPGINLADQGALAFHGMLLNLAFNLSQATVEEKKITGIDTRHLEGDKE